MLMAIRYLRYLARARSSSSLACWSRAGAAVPFRMSANALFSVGSNSAYPALIGRDTDVLASAYCTILAIWAYTGPFAERSLRYFWKACFCTGMLLLIVSVAPVGSIVM